MRGRGNRHWALRGTARFDVEKADSALRWPEAQLKAPDGDQRPF